MNGAPRSQLLFSQLNNFISRFGGLSSYWTCKNRISFDEFPLNAKMYCLKRLIVSYFIKCMCASVLRVMLWDRKSVWEIINQRHKEMFRDICPTRWICLFELDIHIRHYDVDVWCGRKTFRCRSDSADYRWTKRLRLRHVCEL